MGCKKPPAPAPSERCAVPECSYPGSHPMSACAMWRLQWRDCGHNECKSRSTAASGWPCIFAGRYEDTVGPLPHKPAPAPAPSERCAKKKSVTVWLCTFTGVGMKKPWAACYPTRRSLELAQINNMAGYHFGPIVKVEVPCE